MALNKYWCNSRKSCLEASLPTIPTVDYWHNDKVLQPQKEQSLFWHQVCVEAGRSPREALASVMRSS